MSDQESEITQSPNDREPRRGETSVSLFAADGPLLHYPGPALVVGPNNVVLAANARANSVVAALNRGGSRELRAAIEDALAGQSAQVSPLLIEAAALGTSGEGLALDLAVMPWGEGAAALILGRDVTLERNLREALIESRQRYKDLVEASHEFVWETDAQGRFAFVSPRGALGYGAKELIGRAAAELLVEDEKSSEALAVPCPFSTQVPLDNVEIWVSDSSGTQSCLLLTAVPLRRADGEWRGARGVASDVTERRQEDAVIAKARHQERLLSYILGLIRNEMEPGRMLGAAAGALIPALPAAGVAIYRLNQARSEKPVQVVTAGAAIPDDALTEALVEMDGDEMTVDLEHEDGLLLLQTTAYEDVVNGALCIWRCGEQGEWGPEDRRLLEDLSQQLGVALEQQQRQEDLEKQSSTDPLTGLLNRRAFQQKLGERLSQAPGAWRDGVLFYVDLDNFKQVNDRGGHDKGDAALVAVAEILSRFTRRQDLAARLGGDEFALFLVDIPLEAAVRKARTLVRAASQLKQFSQAGAPALGFSVGLAVTDPNRQESLEQLMARADQAMYEVKHGGKSGFAIAAKGKEEDAA